MNPHVLIVIDFNWFGLRCGAAYYDVNKDVFRPAFVDLILWRRWKVTFEAGRVQKVFA